MAEETYTRIWLSTGSDFSVKGEAKVVARAFALGRAEDGVWLEGIEGLPVYVSAEACSKLLVLLEQRRDITQERLDQRRAQAAMSMVPMPAGMRLT